MLTINESTFKTIGKNLTKEINSLTSEKTLSLSASYELLAKSLGYKDYNAIKATAFKEDDFSQKVKPFKEARTKKISNKEELLKYGFIEAFENNIILPKKPTHYLMRSYEKYPLIHLFVIIKNFNKLGFYRINIELLEKIKDLKKTLKELELLLGYKVSMLTNSGESIVYWHTSSLIEIEKNLNSNYQENKFFCLVDKSEGKYSQQAMVQEINENSIKYSLFNGTDMGLSDEFYSMDIKEAKSCSYFVKTDKDMRRLHKLVHDAANREDYSFFEIDNLLEIGLYRAAILVNTNVELVDFILTKLYGYNPDYI